MIKVINKKTGVIKELNNQNEVSMYLGTNEWEIYKEIKINKEVKFISKKDNSKKIDD